MRILIVEDELRLADTLRQLMHENKYTVDVVNDGENGLFYALTDVYDIIILDIMLPKLDGFEVARRLRSKKIKTPIIMLTAKDEVDDKVHGLDCGADDYITKPFDTRELLARIRALSRRQSDAVLDELIYSDIRLNLSNYTLSRNEKSIRLGIKEFEIMRILMSSPDILTSKESLIVKVWGADSEAQDNNVEAYISFLRKKLFYLGSKVNIATIRKIGYHLEAAEND
jgi:DNA-binding response OmpR family regulator